MSRFRQTAEQKNNHVKAQIMRFPVVYRKRMIEFAKIDRAFADLLVSYPGLAFALATHYGGKEECEAARLLVREGLSMIEVADSYGLPRWLRKVPPQALTRTLPKLPTDPAFNKRIINLVPKDQTQMIDWVSWVLTALELAGQNFALWIAKQPVFKQEDIPSISILKPLALYVWHSEQNYTGNMEMKKWNPNMTFPMAVNLASYWFEDLKWEMVEEVSEVKDPWISGQNVKGYDFVPLLDADALSEEGRVMKHCVGGYYGYLTSDACRIFSVREKGKSLATIELRPKYNEEDKLSICQFSGVRNLKVVGKVRNAANHWLESFNTRANPARIRKGNKLYSSRKWLVMWYPFFQENRVSAGFFDHFEEALKALDKVQS